MDLTDPLDLIAIDQLLGTGMLDPPKNHLTQQEVTPMEDWETTDLYDFLGSWECTMSEKEKKLYRIQNLCPEELREQEMEKFKKEYGET